MITFTSTGDFKKTNDFLQRMSKSDMFKQVSGLAQQGTAALAAATPVRTGATAAAWKHEVKISRGGCEITWSNGNSVNGTPIAILLQYGHGTGTGGYVAGRDYINPAMKPVFDKIADAVWKVVTST